MAKYNSALGAAQGAVNDYTSKEYLDYYNSQAPSTQAFLHKPGSAKTAAYLAKETYGDWNAFNSKGVTDPFGYALGDKSGQAPSDTPWMPSNTPTAANPGGGVLTPNFTPAGRTPRMATNYTSPTQIPGFTSNQTPTLGNQASPVNLPGVTNYNPSRAPTQYAGSKVYGNPSLSSGGAPTLKDNVNYSVNNNNKFMTEGSTTTKDGETPQVGVDANGHLTLNGTTANPSNMYGASGHNVTQYDGNTGYGGVTADTYDPRYWMQTGWYDAGDGNMQPQFSLRPEYQSALNGDIQIGQPGVGGEGEVIDPSQVRWHPEFGFLTKPSNIKEPQGSRFTEFMNSGGLVGLLAAGGLGAIGQVGGFSGLTGSAAGASEIPVGEMLSTSIPPTVTESLASIPAITTTAATTAGSTLSQWLSSGKPLASLVPAIINALSGNSGGGGSGLNLGNLPLGDILGGVTGGVLDNNNIGRYRDIITSLIERGDPYGPYRADANRRLRNLETDPGSVANNPMFKALSDKSDTNLERRLAARGLSASGNEMGALQENFLANMNTFYKDEWERLAREAGVYIDPGRSVAAGLEGAGTVLRATNNRDSGITDILGSIFGNSGSGQNGSVTLGDIIRFFTGDGDTTDYGWEGLPENATDLPTEFFDDFNIDW